MQHSFNKLELLLRQKGFSPVNAFTIDGYCVYIEIVSNITSDNFILEEFMLNNEDPYREQRRKRLLPS